MLGWQGVTITTGVDGSIVTLPTLTLGGHLKGLVRGSAPAFLPVPDAVVAVNQGGGFVNVATTGADGWYLAPYLPPSTYQMRVTPPPASGLPTGFRFGVVLGQNDNFQFDRFSSRQRPRGCRR